MTGRAVEFANVNHGLSKRVGSINARKTAHVAGGCYVDSAVVEGGESYDTNLIKRSYYCWIVQDF